MTLTTYLILVGVVILITDLSGFQQAMPLFANLTRKSVVIGHLISCSLCTSWWFTLGCVLFGNVPLWCLFIPFASSLFSQAVAVFIDLIRRLLNLLS